MTEQELLGIAGAIAVLIAMIGVCYCNRLSERKRRKKKDTFFRNNFSLWR